MKRKNPQQPLVTAVIAVTVLVVGLYAYKFAPNSRMTLSGNPEDWAKFGEYVGGSLGAFFGLIAFVSVLISIRVGREANAEAAKAHVNELRPWVTLKTTMQHHISYTARDGWYIVLNYEMANVGRTPARRVEFRAALIPHMLSTMNDGQILQGTNVAAELRQFAEQSRTSASGNVTFGELLFPADKRNSAQGIYHGDLPFAEALLKPHYSGQWLVLVCAVYGATIDRTWHVTADAYAIWLEPIEGLPNKLELINGAPPQLFGRTIGFKRHPLADGYAN